jgi:hypothetical protein
MLSRDYVKNVRAHGCRTVPIRMSSPCIAPPVACQAAPLLGPTTPSNLPQNLLLAGTKLRGEGNTAVTDATRAAMDFGGHALIAVEGFPRTASLDGRQSPPSERTSGRGALEG